MKVTDRWPVAAVVAAVAACSLAGGCGTEPFPDATSAAPTTTAAGASTSSTSSTTIGSSTPSTITTAPQTPDTTEPPAAPDTTEAMIAPAGDPFVWEVHPIDDALAVRMASSWRPGCPVGLDGLRYVTLSIHGFDGTTSTGELVINADAVEAYRQLLGSMWDAGYPIESMVLVDDFGGDDDASMAANNTSAFNCRDATDQPGVWSRHAYGNDIDVNPFYNPWVPADGPVRPAGAEAWADRTRDHPAMLHDHDAVVGQAERSGWRWGGRWQPADAQHFDR